jgi:hypothetical protein
MLAYLAGAAMGALGLLALEVWREYHTAPWRDSRAFAWISAVAVVDLAAAVLLSLASPELLDYEPNGSWEALGQGFAVGVLGLLAIRAPVWDVTGRPEARVGITVVYDVARYEAQKEFEERMSILADGDRKKTVAAISSRWNSTALRGAVEREVETREKRTQGEKGRLTDAAAGGSSLLTEEGRLEGLVKVATDFRLTALLDRIAKDDPAPEDLARGKTALQDDAERAKQLEQRASTNAAEANNRLTSI